ncbi:MAG: hypothetical protein R6W06_08055 [Prochlorococcaceae cyanobacterium]
MRSFCRQRRPAKRLQLTLSLALGVLVPLPIAALVSPLRADDGHGGAAQGLKVETLQRTDRSWNGQLLPPMAPGCACGATSIR